ncbi:MAG: PEP-CTERM sorting domain-containing protein [Methylobacter sp.]|nr:MAG: PEP-CTERM sorting domain-containing protein [Methylobacter sp.]
MKKKIALALSLLFPLPAFSSLTIATTNNGSDLANALLGAGVTISNVALQGAQTQQGFFSGGLSAGIGFESGIILTTGDANSAVGPNTNSNSTTTDSGSDTDLGALINATVLDANVLEFDFQSDSGNISFNYVFASEEYNEFVNSNFNDVFGFFLDGVNIALIPGTSAPVSINNVNLDVNSIFYQNNENAFFNVQYDGFTTVLNASFSGLSNGNHHIKLAIADATDSALDSAVFLQAESFSSSTVPLPPAIWLFGSVLAGFGLIKPRKNYLNKI